jgi:hypothetical protein
MSIRNLEHFFRPQSVAAIGASEKPRSEANRLTVPGHRVAHGGLSYIAPRLVAPNVWAD